MSVGGESRMMNEKQKRLLRSDVALLRDAIEKASELRSALNRLIAIGATFCATVDVLLAETQKHNQCVDAEMWTQKQKPLQS